MNKSSFDLGEKGRHDIDHALACYLMMKKPTRRVLIDDMEATGCFRVFGYASLIGTPHAGADSTVPGIINDLMRDSFCSDLYLRGTHHRQSLTMGARRATGKKLHGVMATIQGKPGEDIAPRILKNICLYAKRENGFNPKEKSGEGFNSPYDHQVGDVVTRFGVAKAVFCGTDESSPQYIGPTVEADDGENLTFEEKAALITASRGARSARDITERVTGMAYWRYVYQCNLKTGVEIEPHILRQVRMANAFRIKLPERLRHGLEKLEDNKDLDPKVFEPDEAAMEVSGRAVLRYRHQGLLKLGKRDPLPPERLNLLKGNMRALKHALGD